MINGKFQTIYDNFFFFHRRYGLFGLNDGLDIYYRLLLKLHRFMVNLLNIE